MTRQSVAAVETRIWKHGRSGDKENSNPRRLREAEAYSQGCSKTEPLDPNRSRHAPREGCRRVCIKSEGRTRVIKHGRKNSKFFGPARAPAPLQGALMGRPLHPGVPRCSTPGYLPAPRRGGLAATETMTLNRYAAVAAWGEGYAIPVASRIWNPGTTPARDRGSLKQAKRRMSFRRTECIPSVRESYVQSALITIASLCSFYYSLLMQCRACSGGRN